jgi:hypothetical protein
MSTTMLDRKLIYHTFNLNHRHRHCLLWQQCIGINLVIKYLSINLIILIVGQLKPSITLSPSAGPTGTRTASRVEEDATEVATAADVEASMRKELSVFISVAGSPVDDPACLELKTLTSTTFELLVRKL